MNEKDWLAALRPGDEVLIPGRWNAGRILKVSRLTPTQIVIDEVGKFRRDSGTVIGRGHAWDRPRLRQVSEDDREAVEREALSNWLQSVADKRKGMSVETLRAMRAAYDASEAVLPPVPRTEPVKETV